MKKKGKKESGAATRASVKKEMAKPRMAKSAREVETSLAAAQITPGNLRKHKLQSLPHAVPQDAW